MSSIGRLEDMVVLRSGIDLVELSRLEGLTPGIRERFLQRIFTSQELAEAGSSDASLMGRFAAKEAVAKVLGSGIGEIGWQDIEISENEHGAPQVHLHGNAAQMAESLNLRLWSISISHSRTHAVAMAVTLGFTTDENG